MLKICIKLLFLNLNEHLIYSALCVCSIEEYRNSVDILDELYAHEQTLDQYLVTVVTSINNVNNTEAICNNVVVEINDYFWVILRFLLFKPIYLIFYFNKF